MEDITDADSAHAKRVVKILKLGEYHDLHVQNDTLLWADVFKIFRNICVNTYELDPAKFLSTPGLAWPVALNWHLLTDIDILLMVNKGITERICQFI